MFSLYKPVKRHVTPWRWVHFWPQGHNFNKLGRCPLGDATYQIIISRLNECLAVSEKKVFHIFLRIPI